MKDLHVAVSYDILTVNWTGSSREYMLRYVVGCRVTVRSPDTMLYLGTHHSKIQSIINILDNYTLYTSTNTITEYYLL